MCTYKTCIRKNNEIVVLFKNIVKLICFGNLMHSQVKQYKKTVTNFGLGGSIIAATFSQIYNKNILGKNSAFSWMKFLRKPFCNFHLSGTEIKL